MTKFYFFLGHEQFQPEELVDLGCFAEELGFDGVLVSAHFHPWVDDVSAGGFAFATLGALAQATRRLQMVTSVVTPLFRFHPAVVAQAAATVSRLSGGRFQLGVGSGENINEGPLGFAFPAYRERAARLTEAVKIMRRLLDGEKLTFQGEYYGTKDAKLYSPPVGEVPIYMAAGGPKSARIAGELAQGAIVSVKDVTEALTDVILPARRAADQAGKASYCVLASRWTVFGENDEEVWQALRSWRGLRAPDRLREHDPQRLREAADRLPREEVIGKFTVIRSADDYYRAYAPLVDVLGADVVGIQTTATDQKAVMEMIATQVVPNLRSVEAVTR